MDIQKKIEISSSLCHFALQNRFQRVPLAEIATNICLLQIKYMSECVCVCVCVHVCVCFYTCTYVRVYAHVCEQLLATKF